MAITEQNRIPGMKRIKNIHFVGIGGSGMCGIAEVLLNQGYIISGSDIKEGEATARLNSLGALISNKHDPKLVQNADLVVMSSAIPAENVEILAARVEGIPVIQRAEMLGELMRYRYGIAIAGTHGKTTTTSMIAEILSVANVSPTFVIGGILNSARSGAVLGSGKHIVVEADESDGSFLKLKPLSSVITNIDKDHMGTYGYDFERLKRSFVDFGNNLPFYGSLALCIDDLNVREIMPSISRRILTYGFDSRAEYRGSAVTVDSKGLWTFKVDRGDALASLKISLPVPGYHNVRNALAAIAIASDEGIPDQTIIEALANFSGVGRRFEVCPRVMLSQRKLTLVDDYGHHPTEIAATISALKENTIGKLYVIFQPHRYTRTKNGFEDFRASLSKADETIVVDIYPAGEEPIPGVSSKNFENKKIKYLKSMRMVPSYLSTRVTENDIILTLGAGDITLLGPQILKYLDEI